MIFERDEMFGKKRKDRPLYTWDEVSERIENTLRNILLKSEETAGSLVAEIKDLVGPKVEIPKLKKQLAELRLDRDIEERDIKHLVKMKEEKLTIENQKLELELKTRYKDKEMAMQTEYHDKIVAQLDLARTEMKQVYRDIMACLPNVNMEMRTGNPEPPAKKAD
jgi:hypothetical protein